MPCRAPSLPPCLVLGVIMTLGGTLAACGGGGTDVISTPAPAPTPAPTPPTAGAAHGTDVLTYKNDLGRTGQNLTETALTPATVVPTSFGLQRILTADGKVDAQPLYVSQLSVGGALHDVVIVATEHDSVYAYDADSGALLWHVSLLGTGETLSDTQKRRSTPRVFPIGRTTATRS